MRIIVFGPAGSGKTLLVKEFGEYLKDYPVSRINLDPGAEYLGYEPGFDIREFFTVKQIMKNKNLGPNGAMLEAVKKMNNQINGIMNKIEKINSDYVFVDTPGQNEIWLFQPLDKKLLDYIKGCVGIFLMDMDVCRDEKNLLLNLLFSLIIKLRFGIPVINVFNKTDLVGHKGLEKIKNGFENPRMLVAMMKEKSHGEIVDVLTGLGIVIGLRAERFIGMSCKNKTGFNELQDILYEVHCACGDLT